MQSIIRPVFDSFRSFNIYRWLLRKTTPWRHRSWPLVLWGQLFKHDCQKIDIAPWFQMKRGYKPSRWCHVLVVSYCVSLSLATFIGPCFSIYENICIPQGMLKSLEIQRDHEGQTRISLNESKSMGGWLFIRNRPDGWMLEDHSTLCCVYLICHWGADGKALQAWDYIITQASR